MANIVFLSVPAYGHLLPVLGVIRELVQRGHNVEVLNGAEMEPVVARTGARFAYPPVQRSRRLHGRSGPRWRRIFPRQELAERDRTDW